MKKDWAALKFPRVLITMEVFNDSPGDSPGEGVLLFEAAVGYDLLAK